MGTGSESVFLKKNKERGKVQEGCERCSRSVTISRKLKSLRDATYYKEGGETTNVGQDVEKGGSLHPESAHVNHHKQYRKQERHPLKY